MSDLRGRAPLSDEQVDRLIDQLDTRPMPSTTFATQTFAMIEPRAREARRRDHRRSHRFLVRLPGSTSQPGRARVTSPAIWWPALPLVALLLLALTILGALATRTPPPPRLIFSTSQGLFLSGLDGAPATQLATLDVNDPESWYAVSENGRLVALTSTAPGAGRGNVEVTVLDVGDGTSRIVARGLFVPGTLSLSPDGSQFAIGEGEVATGAPGTPTVSMVIFDVATGTEVRPGGRWSEGEPAFSWSSDGRRIAAVATVACDPTTFTPEVEVLSVIDTGSGSVHEIGGSNGRPAWSPDGGRLAFVSAPDCSGQDGPAEVRPDHGDGSVAVADVATGAVTRLGTLGIAGNMSWTLDGRWIVYSAPCIIASPNPCLLLVSTDGPAAGSPAPAPSGIVTDGYAWQIVSPSDGWVSPLLSPDGTRLLYFAPCGPPCSGFHGGPHELWVAGADGSSPRQLGGVDVDSLPRWSEDSSWIAYQPATTDTSELWVMRPDGSDAHPLVQDLPDLVRFAIGPAAGR